MIEKDIADLGPDSKQTDKRLVGIKTRQQLIDVCGELGYPVVRNHILVKIGMVSGSSKRYRKMDSSDNRLWRKTFISKSNNNGKRELTIPDSYDLISIHKMIDAVWRNIAISDRSYAYESGRGSIDCAWRVAKTNPSFIWREDIRDFFPSITAKMIANFLVKKLDWDLNVASTVAAVSTYEGKLVQGSILSPHISNVVTRELHNELGTFAANKGMDYVSYSDDLYFFGNGINKEVEQELWDKEKFTIKNIVRNHGFSLNFEKCARRRQGLQVLSMFIRGGCVVPDGKTEGLVRALLLYKLDPSKTPQINNKNASDKEIAGKMNWVFSINKKLFNLKFGAYIKKLKRWYPDTWHELSTLFPVSFREKYFIDDSGKVIKSINTNIAEIAEMLNGDKDE